MFSELLPHLQVFYNGFRYVLDFTVITVLIYYVLYFLRGTRGASVLAGMILVLISLTLLTKYLQFDVLNWLLMNFWTILAISMVVIFQPELRRAFAQLGSRYFSSQSNTQKQTVQEVVQAVRQMSKTRTGALIVFERQIGLAGIKKSAVLLEAKVNATLFLSLFYPNSPLHDGALIIHGDLIEAGHAILPLTQQPEYAAMNLGTRHRAAIGVTEETDAVAVIVSEETGGISVAIRGNLERGISPETLEEILMKNLLSKSSPEDIAEKDSLSGEGME